MFFEATIQAVWNKGKISLKHDPDQVRLDIFGALIVRSHYGNRSSLYGWEIDHVLAESRGGTDSLQNLQPMQWENNCAKSGKLMEACSAVVTSRDGFNNIHC